MELIDNIYIAPELVLVGSCGAYCGLCPKYYSNDDDHCPGCREKEEHSQCRIYRCCDNLKEYFTCGECGEFPCPMYTHKKLGSKSWNDALLVNIKTIREIGLENWLKQQYQRKLILRTILKKYSNGHSIKFYCAVCQLMPLDLLYTSLKEIEENLNGNGQNNRISQIAKAILKEAAKKAHLNL